MIRHVNGVPVTLSPEEEAAELADKAARKAEWERLSKEAPSGRTLEEMREFLIQQGVFPRGQFDAPGRKESE